MKTVKDVCRTLVSVVYFAAAGSAAFADSDANARLAFSDKLSMYSQRVAGSACAMTSPYAPFEAKGFLFVAKTEVDRILAALETGDAALGIKGSEQDEQILALMAQAKREWGPIASVAAKFEDGLPTEGEVKSLNAYIAGFTGTAQSLVSTISNRYTDQQEISLGGSIRIQIAGRQRMMAQKLSAQACEIQKTGDLEQLVALAETMRIFERSSEALRAGMPQVGLAPTTEPELVRALDQIDGLWSELKWPLLALQNGAEWDPITQTRMYLRMNELTHELDKSVGQFVKAVQNVSS